MTQVEINAIKQKANNVKIKTILEEYMKNEGNRMQATFRKTVLGGLCDSQKIKLENL